MKGSPPGEWFLAKDGRSSETHPGPAHTTRAIAPARSPGDRMRAITPVMDQMSCAPLTSPASMV